MNKQNENIQCKKMKDELAERRRGRGGGGGGEGE